MIYIGSQSKFIPYVVEVDKLGQTLAVAPVDRAQGVDQRVIHAAVASFIQSARMVTPDVALQRKAIFAVYAMLSPDDPATAKMNEFLNGRPESSPFKRAEKEMVSTEIVSVIAQTPQTWQVDWTETVRDRQGIVKITALPHARAGDGVCGRTLPRHQRGPAAQQSAGHFCVRLCLVQTTLRQAAMRVSFEIPDIPVIPAIL